MLTAETFAALDTVLSGSLDSLFVHDRAGRCLYASPGVVSVLSAELEHVVGKTWRESDLPAGLTESLERAREEADSTGSGAIHEFTVPADEGERAFSCAMHTIGERESEHRAVVSTIRDATEQRREQEETAKLARLFRTLMDRAPDQIYFKDREHRFTHVNPPVAENMGAVGPDDMLGKTDLDFVPERHAREFMAQEQKIFETGEGVIGSVEPYDDGGDVVWAHVTKVPTRDADGRVDGLVGINRDVTDYVETRDALTRAEARYRTLFEASNVAIGLAEPEGQIVDANPALCEMLGYSREELVGMRVMEVVHPDDREGMGRRYREVAAGRESGTRSETRFMRKDGSTLWTDRAGAAVRDEDGELLGLMVVLTDITGRKEVEAQLLEEQRLFQALMRGVPDAIYFKDLESRFVRVNEATARENGVDDPHQLVGRTDIDLISEDRARVYRAEEEKLFATGESVTHVYEPVTRDGRTYGWKHVTKAPLRDEEGGIVGLIGISRDISDLMEAQSELRESEERFRAVFESAQLGITLADATGRIFQTNEAFQRMLGYGEAELCELSVADITHAEDVAETAAVIRHMALGDRDVVDMEKRFVRKDGEVVWGRSIATSIRDAHGDVAYNMAMVEDITERRRIEQELATRAANQQALFNAMPDLVYELGQDGTILSVHGGRGTPMYRPREELLGKSTREITPPEVASQLLEAIHLAAETGEVQTLEYDLDIGGELHTRESYFVQLQEGPIAAITRDVTERRQYERRLEERVRERTQELNRELEDRVRAERELGRSQEERTLLLRRILSVQEEERTRIARELHDQTGQALTSLLVGLRVLEAADSVDVVQRRVSELRAATSEALERVRTLSFELRPSSVDHFGLESALNQDLETFGARFGATVDFYVDDDAGYALSEDVETAIYRAVHGALTNIVQHAEAEHVSVIMREENGRLSVLVEDDGVGFDVDAVMSGAVAARFGILAMEERMQSVGGGLRVESSPGGGTTVYIQAPLQVSD
ncbi:PAS domain S-box protein [Candidatus Poribacteria bacterium]|jgi:PAS domain S-box-containing protein|nr:PAS domain S-box protein [Candidatus Poribacteria bacterium]MBT7099491.1 PAS domain S-box protein [Candidatus Poribacteria bacterium]MBT7805145.1 PAS domain S-box protein [Candidatus Poribacteria bacterium]